MKILEILYLGLEFGVPVTITPEARHEFPPRLKRHDVSPRSH